MGTGRRILLKAVTWQVLGLVSMTLIGYFYTGSVRAGTGIAFMGMSVGFVSYILHEAVWTRIQWGRDI